MKQFDSFRLDTSNECLWNSGVQIALPPKPFAILRYLVENPGRLITHDELLDALWPETYVQPQVLRTYMLELRKVLGDDAGAPRFIQTLPKRGYCFVAAERTICSCVTGHR
jgi:DNA-binding winged helix-turn-helix (wHTH) protein